MPAISSVVLTDGTTPITLSPVGGDNVTGQTRYRTTDGATMAANSELLFSSKMNQNKIQRQYAKLTKPITAVSADTGETLVRESIIIEMTVRVPPEATSAQRAQAVNQFLSIASASALETELETGEGQW